MWEFQPAEPLEGWDSISEQNTCLKQYRSTEYGDNINAMEGIEKIKSSKFSDGWRLSHGEDGI